MIQAAMQRFRTTSLAVVVLIAIAGLVFGASAHAADAAGQPAVAVADQAAELEERIVDLQVEIATMRSLAANAEPANTGLPSARPHTPHMQGVDAGSRLAALESELKSLASQLRQLSGRPGAIMPAATKATMPHRDARAIAPPANDAMAAAPADSSITPSTSVGTGQGWSASTTTVTAGGNSAELRPQGELLPGAGYPVARGQGPAVYPQQGGTNPAMPPQNDNVAGWAQPEKSTGDAETDYQTAYGYLLQQDYGAAQVAFKEFLTRYPKTVLAGNAQYWIGETHYVQGAYKEAAVAFLAGYEKYGDGNKGPDSLLKLALSLAKLRQTGAACSSLRELATRYHNAPQTLLVRGSKEQDRLKCPR